MSCDPIQRLHPLKSAQWVTVAVPIRGRHCSLCPSKDAALYWDTAKILQEIDTLLSPALKHSWPILIYQLIPSSQTSLCRFFFFKFKFKYWCLHSFQCYFMEMIKSVVNRSLLNSKSDTISKEDKNFF